MNIQREIGVRTEEIEKILHREFPRAEGLQKTVVDAMRYSFFSGGKRLRPMLMAETARLFGHRSGMLSAFMTAIEMIHTYSLIHDDLPAMDNDDYRRGKKTAHIVYGEAMAILAGDALLNLAGEKMAQAVLQNGEHEKGLRAMEKIMTGAGYLGMIGGQVVDVEQEGRRLDAETLLFIHEKKTGALIDAAMSAGAILGGAETEEVSLISEAAKQIGIAFQIRDDILDVCGQEELIGKPVGSDARNEKVTYVTLYGLKKAEQDVERYSGKALEMMRQLNRQNEFLDGLLWHLTGRQR